MNERVGDAFVESMDLYHGSYDREDGKRVERALKLMEEMLNEIEPTLAE